GRGARPRARAGAAHAVHAADRGGAGDGGIRALHAAGFADFLRLLCRAAIRHPALAMDGGHDRHRPALRRLSVRGLSWRAGERAQGPVGGGEIAQPVDGAHLFPRHPPAGPAAVAGRHGQLSRRHLQGHADAVGDRGGRADAHGHRHRVRHLSLPRALHAGRGHIPSPLAANGGGDPALRGLDAPQTRNELMDTKDVSGFPLALEGDAAPMVSFRKVTKSYGSLVVLDSLDLDITEGEMVTIIGPSGSGKTTVLRMLMTLETIN